MPRAAGAAARRRRVGVHGDEGFTLIEVLMATVVFAILATAFATSLTASMRSYQASKVRTVAEQLASSQLEDARRLAYDDLGTVGGNPPGLLQALQTVTDAGQTLNVTTKVSYVNDPTPNSTETGADYKLIRVTVLSSAVPTLNVNLQSYVAPPTQPSLDQGLIKLRVVDYALNQPVVGATVNLGTGPSAPRSDTTDAAGWVSFAALDPTTGSGTYALTVSASGYAVLPEDQPPAPAVKTTISAGQVFTTAVRVYKPATMNVHLVTSTGTPFTTAATLTISSSRGSGTASVSGGNAAITAVGTDPLIPSVQYTVGATATGFNAPSETLTTFPDLYPSVLTSDVTLVMAATSTTGTVKVTLKSSTGTKIANSVVVITGGPGGVVLAGTTNSSGVVSFTVPAGTSPVYTISALAQGLYDAATTTSAGPAAGATVNVTLTVVKL